MKKIYLGVPLFFAVVLVAGDADSIGLRAKRVCANYRHEWELNVKNKLPVALGTRVFADMMDGAETGCIYGYRMGVVEAGPERREP